MISDYYHVDNNKWYIGEVLPSGVITYDTAKPGGEIRSAEPGEEVLPIKWEFFADGKWTEDAELKISGELKHTNTYKGTFFCVFLKPVPIHIPNAKKSSS